MQPYCKGTVYSYIHETKSPSTLRGDWLGFQRPVGYLAIVAFNRWRHIYALSLRVAESDRMAKYTVNCASAAAVVVVAAAAATAATTKCMSYSESEVNGYAA